MQLWLCSQRVLSLQSGGLASPRHATRCNGWDGLNPRPQRIAPSRWADQGISRALVQSQSCKMENWMRKIELGCFLLFKLLQLQEHEIIYTSFSANRPNRLLVRALD